MGKDYGLPLATVTHKCRIFLVYFACLLTLYKSFKICKGLGYFVLVTVHSTDLSVDTIASRYKCFVFIAQLFSLVSSDLKIFLDKARSTKHKRISETAGKI